jgi:hypothetical protein
MVAMKAEGKSLRAIAEAMKGEGFTLSRVGVKKILSRALDWHVVA